MQKYIRIHTLIVTFTFLIGCAFLGKGSGDAWRLNFSCTPFAKVAAASTAKSYSETYSIEVVESSNTTQFISVIRWSEAGIEIVAMNNLGAKIYSAEVGYADGRVAHKTMPFYRDVKFLPIVQGLLLSVYEAGGTECTLDKEREANWYISEGVAGQFNAYSLPDLGYNVRARRL